MEFKKTAALMGWLADHGYCNAGATDEKIIKNAVTAAVAQGKLSEETLTELSGLSESPTAEKAFARVKKPSERYSTTKSVGKHARSGEAVRDERGRTVETPSELEYAKAGAFLKYRAGRDGVSVNLSEHERELVAEMFDKDTWAGKIGSEYQTGIPGASVKALLSDATSGGQEVSPEWFDAAVVQYPLLHSEILPLCDLRDVPRGSAVEGAAIGNPTVTWGTAEGTGLSPFDTSSLVSAIDTSIHPVSVGIEVGRDFLSDAAVDVGRILVENIGQRMLAELDRVIVDGNGTSEPEGLFNASGTTDIGNPAGGAGADPQVNDYEALLFGLPKQYRTPANRTAFIANDTTYSRAMGISVGTADARRVFGMTHNGYRILENPFLISNDLGNNVAGFAALAKYRLYRRMGQEVRFTSEGKELATKNLTLLVVRGRYGGKLVDPNALAFSDNWKA